MDVIITDETPNIELIITDENQEIVLQITDEEPPLQIFIDDHHGLSAYQLYLLVTTDDPPMTLEEWLESLAGGDLSGKANADASNIDPHIPAWRAKLSQEPEDPTEEQTASAPKSRTEDGWRTISNTTPAFIALGNNPAGSFHLTGSSDVQGFITKQGKFLWPGREFVIKTDQAVTLKASTFTDTSNAKHWTFAEDFALKADSWAIIKEKAGELLVIEMGADVDLSPYALDADLDAEIVNRAAADALKLNKDGSNATIATFTEEYDRILIRSSLTGKFSDRDISEFSFTKKYLDFKNIKPIQNDLLCNFDRQSTWNGSNYDDFVHPSVLYFPNKWNNHVWWMGVNAYAATQGSTENPYLFYSDDGITWKTMTGATNPIYGLTASTTHNSDANIIMEGNRMWYTNRAVKPAGRVVIEAFYTDDAVTFSTPVAIFDTNNGTPDLVSQSICRADGKWYLFGTPVNDTSVLKVYESLNILSGWVEINTISTGLQFNAVWHTDVKYWDGVFYILGTTGYTNGGNLVIGTLLSVMDSVINFRNNVLSVSKGTTNSNAAYYKSSLVIKDKENFEIFAGIKGPGLASSTKWRVERLVISKYTEKLNKDGYVQLQGYGGNNAENGFADNRRSMDYDQYLLTAKLRIINGDLSPLAFGSSIFTSYHLKIQMTAGILSVSMWRPGVQKYTSIFYGIEVDDEIAFLKTLSFVAIYLNEIEIWRYDFTDINDYKYWLNRGTGIGELVTGNQYLSDIKYFKKSEHIFNPTASASEVSSEIANALSNPTQYWMMDRFNRAALGTVDETGKSYTIVGSPIIESSTRLRPTNGALLVPHDGKFIAWYSKSPFDGFNLFFLKYTDSNNYIALLQTQSGYVQIVHRVEGVSTNIPEAIPPIDTSRLNWKLIFNNNIVSVYVDTVWLVDITIPTNSFNNFCGCGSTLTNCYFDNVIVKKI